MTTKKNIKNAKNINANEQVINAAKDAAEQIAQAKTERQQAAQAKREWLRAISAQLQAQRDLMAMTGMTDVPTINDMLRAYYAKQNNVTELNTFDQWKEKGYQVRRGAKAFLFWGKPQAKPQPQTEQGEDGQAEQPEQTAKKNEFYPVCYLFDISQCHKNA